MRREEWGAAAQRCPLRLVVRRRAATPVVNNEWEQLATVKRRAATLLAKLVDAARRVRLSGWFGR